MKKLLALILAAIMLMSCILLTSCSGRPELDLDEAEDNLEDEDYYVSYNDDPSDPMYKETFSASNDDDDFLYIYKFDSAAIAKLYLKGLKLNEKQEKEQLELEIKMLQKLIKLYDDEYDSDELDELEDELKDLKKELKDLKNKKNVTYGRSGKTVWYGTKSAIKDSKG